MWFWRNGFGLRSNIATTIEAVERLFNNSFHFWFFYLIIHQKPDRRALIIGNGQIKVLLVWGVWHGFENRPIIG